MREEASPTSSELAARIAALDLSRSSALVVGHGFAGKEHVKALEALGTGSIAVCSSSERSLETLHGKRTIEVIAGGFAKLERRARPGEVAIVATPTRAIAAAARRLVELGYRRLLLEKPVALESRAIEALADELAAAGVEAFAAWNRVCYPSVVEARARCSLEGGVTSCTFTVTEMIKPDWPERFPREELHRWGVANSLHVVSLVGALSGMPKKLEVETSGAGRIAWHLHASVFVGSGKTESDVPFSYHGDWTSNGRWSVEVHSRAASYRFCPLEELRRKTAPLAEWELVPVAAFAPSVKVGFAEQAAALLEPTLAKAMPLVSLREAAALARAGEKIFGYETEARS